MVPARQVIFTHGGGRLGNQVLRFAHWMAWTLEHAGEVEVRNLSFWPQSDYFAVWRSHPGCLFPPRADWGDEIARARAALPRWGQRQLDPRLQNRSQLWGPRLPGSQGIALAEFAGEARDLASAEFWKMVNRYRRTFCSGWRYSAWGLLAKHEAAVRPYFRPAMDYAQPAQSFVAELRRRHGLLIGVLVRQSDYRVWEGGQFFHPTRRYAEWIRQVLALYADRHPAAIVASEEWQDPSEYRGMAVYQATGNVGAARHWFENWVELALCDVIVSVSSTFSATASFYGAKPLWPLVAADQVMHPAQIWPGGMIEASRHLEFSRSVN